MNKGNKHDKKVNYIKSRMKDIEIIETLRLRSYLQFLSVT